MSSGTADSAAFTSTCAVHRSPMPRVALLRVRYGVTVVELLIVVAIAAVLLALLLAAVQQSRASSRRMVCQSHLRQIGIAIANYEATYQYLPPGVDPGGYSVHFRLLPFIEKGELYDRFDLSKAYDDPPNASIHAHGVSIFKCPSNLEDSPLNVPEYTSYIASAGGGNPALQNGLFVNIKRYGVLSSSHATDGTSHTAAVTEAVAHPFSAPGTILYGRGVVFKTMSQYAIPSQLDALIQDCLSGASTPTHRSLGREWISGSLAVTRFIHVLPPNSPSCQNGSLISHGIYTPSSNHAGGVNVVFGDGAVKFVSDEVGRAVWISVGTRSDGDHTGPY